METRRDSGDSSDSSSGGSSSSSSSDTVLISKPLHQKHRKKLQAQLQQQAGARAVAADAASNVQPQGANESAKVDDICLVCEREGDLYLCTGPCVSAFHLRCLGINREPPAKETWMCPSCTSNAHVCFYCKRLGVSSSPEGSPAPTSGAPAASSVANAEDLRPVRKCRALSCGKFYHPECITNLPLARIAGSNKHFICPHDASERAAAPVVIVTAADAFSDGKSTVSTKQSSRMLSTSDTEKQRSRDRRADNDEDIKSEASVTTGGMTSSSSKKLSKSSKREKKKKKKKRKKMKKHESRERSHDDDDDVDKESSKGKKKASTRTDSDDDEDEDDGDALSDAGAVVKREVASSDSITIPAIPASHTEAISPATSTFFESPGKIKARLDEALGRSDDELDNVESPVPKPKHEEEAAAPEVTPMNSNDAVLQPTAVKTPSEDEGLSSVKREPQPPTPAPLADSAIVEQSRSPSSTIQPRPSLPSTSRAEPDESGHSASDSVSASQSSGEKKSKSERKVRRESFSSSSTDGKDLVRQSLFKDNSERKGSKKQKRELSDLSQQISGSPMNSELKTPRGVEVEDSSLKISVSEGEDGDDEGPGGSSTLSSRRRSSVGTPRSGAVDMASLARANKKKKKKKTKSEGDAPTDAKRDEKRSKKRGPDDEDDSEKTEANAEEAKWVQCDSCKKWRTVPKDIDLNSMPERWYCKMNTWDSAYASCAVAEEVVDAASKKQKSGSHVKRSSGKIKVKQQPDNSNPTAFALSDGEGSSHSSGSNTSKKAAVEGVDTPTADEKGSKLSKKQESKAKKRKMKLKLKEKYREVKWVQCENAQCGKWRVVPSSIDFNLLPAVWYCHLNTWAPEIANCSAPNPPEVDTFLLKSQSKKGGSSSARPTKKHKPTGETSSSAAVASSEIPPVAQQSVAVSIPDAPLKPAKSGKPPKGTHQTASQSGSSASDNVPPATPRGANSGGSTAGGQVSAGGVPGASHSAHTSSQSPSGFPTSVPIGGGKGRKVKPDGIKKAVLEWAQCEKCNKWRKLPQHIKSSTLPDKWYCSMNHWDPTRASCSIPEEVDQEPLGASPLPSSQNWYPMPGQVGGGNNGGGTGFFRSKRGKLSYSELLYASTGQLRKTYTSESSTLAFEHEGRTYHRDDQYRSSSMYVSPDSMVSKTKGNTSSVEAAGSADGGAQATSPSVDADGSENIINAPMENQPSVEQISACLLEAMDLRHNSSISELVRAVNRDAKFKIGGSSVTLSLITAALNQLIRRGLIENVEDDHCVEEAADDDTSSQVGVKRRKVSGVPHSSLQYRKVPKRPLKASKCWKFGQSPFEFPLKE
ncbi:Chromodomain-helicase-dna-binding protein, partial [Globisporangium splendens]